MSEETSAAGGSGEAAASGGLESAGAALGVDFGSGSIAEPVDSPVESQGVSEPQNASGWLDGYSIEDRAYIENKGWKDPAAILNSYKHAVQRIGGDPTDAIQVPDWDNEEQVSEFRAKIGVPQEASGYPELEVQTADGQAMPLDEVNRIAHQIGLTPAQRAQLAMITSQLIDSERSHSEAQFAAQVAQESKEVMAEYGKTPKEFDAMVKRGIQALGFTQDDSRQLTQAIGVKKAVKILSTVAAATTEKAVVNDGDSLGSMGQMSQEVARKRRSLLIKDDNFRKRMFDGDVQAIEEWNKIQEAAAG